MNAPKMHWFAKLIWLAVAARVFWFIFFNRSFYETGGTIPELIMGAVGAAVVTVLSYEIARNKRKKDPLNIRKHLDEDKS